ncbi:bacterial alpha-L-rhamnosidase-domain-containing protein [Amylocarpus encephaloides]|uniref:alpha-L-rhamnosidase n=1 Tax=Amylocarpus encephaloides TaxID=45428 RepID=A0A9P7YLE1_9HELO|nr:bacterial alpha-L-rhamnosidase-domain-containing protein [Amylocarpus encephaloides]
MTIKVCKPTFEHHRETLGIGESSPRVSWRFEADAETKNWTQTSYEIEITSSSAGGHNLFKVDSNESVLVPWPTTPLRSRECTSVRVRVSGSDGVPTAWSDPAVVETGLLHRGDWIAKMVAAEPVLSTSGSLRPTMFRQTFDLDTENQKVAFARLYITSYGIYEAAVNGKRVGDHLLSPGWTSYKHRLCYQTFDVTELLQNGDNRIAVTVAEGWYCGRLGFNGGQRFIYGDRLAVLAQIEIQYRDGGATTIGSDESWTCNSSGPLISSELYDGEICDTRVKNWNEDTGATSSVVQVLDFPPADLVVSEGPPIRKTQTVQPQDIFRSPSRKVIVDFGQNLVGYVRLRTPGSSSRMIVLTHTEALEHGEVATRPLRDCKATDTLILGDGPIEWQPRFTFHGFRYVQIDGWPSSTGEPTSEDLEAIVIHTDMEPTGGFECSDPNVNKLFENIKWSMRGNFVGIPTDCPQRDERLGWTGDIQAFSPTANFLYGTSGMLSTWLKDLALEQIRDFNGVVPQVIPNVIDAKLNSPQAVWGDAAITTPWDLFLDFGDKTILENQYQSMVEWWFSIPKSPETGLWDSTKHQLGDWLDPAAPPTSPADGRTDPHFVANAYLVHVTELLQRISTVLNRAEEAKKFAATLPRLRSIFQDNYITPSGRLAPDTMTSLSLALIFNLFSTPEHVEKARGRLARLARASRFKIGTGFVGTPIILQALSSGVDKKYKQIAYRMLLEKKCPSWLYPITMGATTMWERWDSMLPNGDINPGSMTSFNHYALGSIGKWLTGYVGGIDILNPDPDDALESTGWRSIKVAPVLGGTVEHASTWHLSPYGKVSCEWMLDIEAKLLKMTVAIPPNSKGTIELPGKPKEEVVNVGSGTWNFVVEGYDETQEWPPKPIIDPFTLPEADE